MNCPSCGHDGLPPLVCEHCGHRWYATPAPLDVERLAEAIDKHRMPLLICDDCGDESRNPECRSCGGRMHLATPAPLDALCGAVLTCALPILHDGDHERADGIRWTWPATPAPLDVEHADCGGMCDCFRRGVQDEWEQTRD